MGEYAAAYVAAMQWGAEYDGAPADTRGVTLKTANTCKHFAGRVKGHRVDVLRLHLSTCPIPPTPTTL